MQFQGTQDKTNLPSLNRQTNVLILADGVNRGRLDKIETITHHNINAKLGYNRDSLIFQAVQDVLNTGVPSLLIMRCFKKPSSITIDKPVGEIQITTSSGFNQTVRIEDLVLNGFEIVITHDKVTFNNISKQDVRLTIGQNSYELAG